MKLTTKTGIYVSPLPNQGNFTGVAIEDREIIIRRAEKFMSVKFVMFYEKDEKEIILGTKVMEFRGMESDPREETTNETAFFRYPNPNYDPAWEPSENSTPEDFDTYSLEWFENVPLIKYLQEHEGVLPESAEITEYGYPTYEAVLQYFNGGTLEAPEMFISDPIAIGFILSKLSINGEIVGKQFQLEE